MASSPPRVRSLSTIGILPSKAAALEVDRSAFDVVPESVAAQAETPLALSWSCALEFLDVVFPASVMGIGVNDVEHLGVDSREVRVASRKALGEAIEVRGSGNRKRRRHGVRRRRVDLLFRFFADSRRSAATSSCAGLLLPARSSAVLLRMSFRALGSFNSR